MQLTSGMPYADVLRVLISDHLTDIQQNRLPAIEKRTGYPLETIKEAIEQLRRLDPRPGARFSQDDNQYVLPDLIVEPDEHGEYQVRLVDDYSPQLGISRSYQKMLKNKQADPAAGSSCRRRFSQHGGLLSPSSSGGIPC